MKPGFDKRNSGARARRCCVARANARRHRNAASLRAHYLRYTSRWATARMEEPVAVC